MADHALLAIESDARRKPLSGAFPLFPPPNPLSREVLGTHPQPHWGSFNHFQSFQALKALERSYLHHALAGNFTLLLLARREASGRDPGHIAFL